jgi:hypothetical protein
MTLAGTSSQGWGFLALILAAAPGVERFFLTEVILMSFG